MNKLLLNSMSEAELQRNVIDLAHTLGYGLVAHFRPAMVRKTRLAIKRTNGSISIVDEPVYATAGSGDYEGYPDLFLVDDIRQRVLWIELKSQSGSLSREQRKWRDYLQAAGQKWYCFKPSDWFSGRIEEVLK